MNFCLMDIENEHGSVLAITHVLCCRLLYLSIYMVMMYMLGDED